MKLPLAHNTIGTQNTAKAVERPATPADEHYFKLEPSAKQHDPSSGFDFLHEKVIVPSWRKLLELRLKKAYQETSLLAHLWLHLRTRARMSCLITLSCELPRPSPNPNDGAYPGR